MVLSGASFFRSLSTDISLNWIHFSNSCTNFYQVLSCKYPTFFVVSQKGAIRSDKSKRKFSVYRFPQWQVAMVAEHAKIASQHRSLTLTTPTDQQPTWNKYTKKKNIQRCRSHTRTPQVFCRSVRVGVSPGCASKTSLLGRVVFAMISSIKI